MPLSGDKTEIMEQRLLPTVFRSPHQEPQVPPGRERGLVGENHPSPIVPRLCLVVSGKSKTILLVWFAEERLSGRYAA